MTRLQDWSELLIVLEELHAAAPDMRFGQLILNLATLAGHPEPEGLWDIEDQEVSDAARQLLNTLRSETTLGVGHDA